MVTAHQKQAASVKISYLVNNGRIERPRLCSECGIAKDRIEGHHPDYAQPLKVTWLCRKCHRDLHTYLRKSDPERWGKQDTELELLETRKLNRLLARHRRNNG